MENPSYQTAAKEPEAPPVQTTPPVTTKPVTTTQTTTALPTKPPTGGGSTTTTVWPSQPVTLTVTVQLPETVRTVSYWPDCCSYRAR